MFLMGFQTFLRKMDQKYKFGGINGSGDSCLEFLFRHFKLFRLNAILNDDAGAVRAHNGKSPGYCYMIDWRPNLRFHGQVTGLLICHHVKKFPPSICNSVAFQSSNSCFIQDIELAEINVIEEVGVFIDGRVLGYSFRPAKKYKPTKQASWCTKKLHGIVSNSRCLDYSELPNILPGDIKGE